MPIEVYDTVELMGVQAGVLVEYMNPRTGEKYIRYPHDQF